MKEYREMTKEEIRQKVIALLSEDDWKFACYHININGLIKCCFSVHEVAESIQDLIATEAKKITQRNSN